MSRADRDAWMEPPPSLLNGMRLIEKKGLRTGELSPSFTKHFIAYRSMKVKLEA